MTRFLLLGMLTFALAGCGTVANLHSSGDREMYGGVRQAVGDIRESSEPDVNVAAPWVVWPMMVANVPLSAIGDTVTLPFTAVAELKRISRGEPKLSREEKEYWDKFWGAQESRELPVEKMP